jgi:threonine/homoserine/homoserine lactone efflux protein
MGASPHPAVLVVESMLEFILAVLFVELTPGPNMAYLAALALARGRTAGLFAIIGVALGLSVHAAVASFGAGKLLLLYPWLYEILRWIGVAYLLFLAWEGWQANEKSPSTAELNSAPGPLIVRGFLSNAFNPKSVLFFVSVVPTFVGISPGQPNFPFQMAIFGIVYVAIATAVHTAIVMLAAELRPWLVEGARQNVVRRVLAIALVFVAGWLFWATKH